MTKYFLFFLGALWGGEACYATTHHPQAFLARVTGTNDEGMQIAQHFCASCHASTPLIPVGAPRMHHHADWKSRVQQGLSSLLHHVHEGVGAMPARGGCFECSDEQLLLAIRALIPQEELDILFKNNKASK